MSDRIETVIVEAFKDAEVDCTWTPEGHATHVLAALKAARIAIVELPDRFTPPRRTNGWYWFDSYGTPVGPVSIVNDGTRVALPGGKHMRPLEARRCAAALIAAADAAEVSG